MIKYFDGFMAQFVTRELLVIFKFIKILSLMMLFAHLSACLWFFVGYNTMNDETGSWITNFMIPRECIIDNIPSDECPVITQNEINGMDTFPLYSTSWYWAVVTLFTTGYGDITATYGNVAEQWVVSICILIGTCFFAYFVGTLTSLITEGDRIRSVQIEKLEQAQSFCDIKRLPRELSRAILTHIRYHCIYNYVFDESDLITSLPPYLQNDIHSYLAQNILSQLSIFQHLFKHQNLEILGQISLKMKSISCNENFRLFKKGDRAKVFYIQRTGEAILTFNDGEERICHRGDVIGEQSIISPKRKYSVKCDTFCEFYVLSVQDILNILQTEYPKTWSKRWRKMRNNLKNDLNKDDKRILHIDYEKKNNMNNAHLSNINLLDGIDNNEPHKSSLKRGLKSFLTTSSTIDLSKTPGFNNNKTNKVLISSLSPTATNTNTTIDINIDGDVDDININQPKLQHTRSVPKPIANNNNKKHRKFSIHFSKLIKRNSLIRNEMIHKSHQNRYKEHKTFQDLRRQTSVINRSINKNIDRSSFFDDICSPESDGNNSDSSDASGDIVPGLEFDDDDDDDGNINTELEFEEEEDDNKYNKYLKHDNDNDILAAIDLQLSPSNKKQQQIQIKFNQSDRKGIGSTGTRRIKTGKFGKMRKGLKPKLSSSLKGQIKKNGISKNNKNENKIEKIKTEEEKKESKYKMENITITTPDSSYLNKPKVPIASNIKRDSKSNAINQDSSTTKIQMVDMNNNDQIVYISEYNENDIHVDNVEELDDSENMELSTKESSHL